MLLKEISEVHKPEVIYKDDQGAIFLENNRQVVKCTKHIDIRHHFLRGMLEDKDMYTKYIRSVF